MWEVMYWWSTYLQDAISYHLLCFTGRYFLLDDMFYLSTCFADRHILQDNLSYNRIPLRWTGFTGGYVL